MKKLLLIDTSERDKEIIKSILDVEFDVIVARNGTEGLSILDSMPSISVAVLVFPLIGLNGMETLQTIRSDSRFKHMAVVVVEKGKVSVIVPCYKQAEYLSETLDSVFTQTYQNWECVIVNDGSLSASVEKVYDAVMMIRNYKGDQIQSTGSGFVYKVDEAKMLPVNSAKLL